MKNMLFGVMLGCIISWIFYINNWNKIDQHTNSFQVIDTIDNNYLVIEGDSFQISSEVYELFDQCKVLNVYCNY